MRGFWRRCQELLRRGRLDDEISEEMLHHIDLLTARKVAAGLSEAEARRCARAELGSVLAARESVADGRAGAALDRCRRDLTQAVRSAWRSPHATVLSVLAIGAGIGASAILFSLVNGIVLQPLSYPESGRLVRIFDTNLQAGVDGTGVASGNLKEWRLRATGFDGIAGYYALGRTAGGDTAEVLITANVSRDFFDVMGIQPVLGRVFTDEEFLASRYDSAMAPVGVDPVVVLSDAAWTRRFGRDPEVVGRSMTLDRQTFRIVGVMPPSFAFPDEGVELWIPWDLTGDRPRDQHYLGAVGRLARGTSLDEASAGLNDVAAALDDEYPATNRGWRVRLVPLRDEIVGEAAGLLWLLFGAVALVLVVGCANVALLTLLRGLDRADEAALRVVLGASPARLRREFLLESPLPAVAGGVLGLGIAIAGLRVLPSLISGVPRLAEVSLDHRALAFIAAVTMATAVLTGVPQAWRRSRMAFVRGHLSSRERVTPARHRLRDTLAASQVGLAVVLLLASGLLVRSVAELGRVDHGFDPGGVLVVPVFLDSHAYPTGSAARAYYQTLFDRLAVLSGVDAVGGATTVPTSPLGPDFDRPVWPDGATDAASRIPASVRIVTNGYVDAMGLRLIDGRGVDATDGPDAPRVVMVSETLSRRVWPGQRAVGRQLYVDYGTAGTYPYEVIGVVGDIRFGGPRSQARPEVYFPHAQRSYLILNVVVKTSVDPRAVIPSIREVLRRVDPQKPAHGFYALDDLVGATYARDRQAMVALLVFAGAAIVLAVLGVYGVLAHGVRERTRALGISAALGASPARLIGSVAWAGARLIAAGVAGGLITALALGGLIRAWLFGVSPVDPATIVVVVLLVLAAGVLAACLPAWRAARIDPIAVLRRG